MSETTEQYLPAEETDDSCRLEFIEIVQLTRNTHGPCTTKYESGDWSAEGKQHNFPGNSDILYISGELALAAVDTST